VRSRTNQYPDASASLATRSDAPIGRFARVAASVCCWVSTTLRTTRKQEARLACYSVAMPVASPAAASQSMTRVISWRSMKAARHETLVDRAQSRNQRGAHPIQRRPLDDAAVRFSESVEMIVGVGAARGARSISVDCDLHVHELPLERNAIDLARRTHLARDLTAALVRKSRNPIHCVKIHRLSHESSGFILLNNNSC